MSMQLRINNAVIASELFLGDEIDVEVALVDPTRESCPLISAVSFELDIRAVCETGDELILDPLLSRPCISRGACCIKVSLNPTCLCNLRSVGQTFSIVISASQYDLVERSKPIRIIRARLHIDNIEDLPSVFYKDAKTSMISLVLSLRDKNHKVVEQFLQLSLVPMYEDCSNPKGISPVANCRVLQVGESRYLHLGRGKVDVRLVENSRATIHRNRRFVVMVMADDAKSGISPVGTSPIEVQAKYHKKTGLQAGHGKPGNSHLREVPAQAQVGRPVGSLKKEVQMPISPWAIGEYIVNQLKSFRWQEADVPHGAGYASPFYVGVSNPNKAIDQLQSRLKAFRNGDTSVFSDCIGGGVEVPPMPLPACKEEPLCAQEWDTCGAGLDFPQSFPLPFPGVSSPPLTPCYYFSEEEGEGEEHIDTKDLYPAPKREGVATKRQDHEQHGVGRAADGVNFFDKYYKKNVINYVMKDEKNIKKESLKLETSDSVSVRSSASSAWDELFFLDDVMSIGFDAVEGGGCVGGQDFSSSKKRSLNQWDEDSRSPKHWRYDNSS